MAIPWDTVRPELLSLVNNLSGLQTIWIDKRRPFTDPTGQAWALLRIRTAVGIGIDDRRYTDLEKGIPAATLEETLNGHRRVSLEIRVESFRHDDDRFAFNAASDIGTRIGFNSSLARLRGVNMSLIRVGQAIDLPNILKDDRITSVALLEVFLNAGITAADGAAAAADAGEEDPTANHVFTIESVETPEGTFTP